MITWRDSVVAGNWVVVSGQLPMADGPGGGLVSAEGGTRQSLVAAQTRQSLKRIVAELEKNGLTASDVVKTTVYLVSMDESMEDYEAMNEEYAKVFPTDQPARMTLAAHELALGSLVEIDCWAYRGISS